MKIHSIRFILSFFVILPAIAVAQDVVHYKDGKVESALVAEITNEFVTLKDLKPPQASRQVEIGKIATVKFGPRPGMDLVEGTKGNARIEALRRIWYVLRPSLELPESPAGTWGLDFADAILNSEVEDHVKLSFEVFNNIEQRDWNRERRHRASRGRFNAMLNLHMFDEALAAAKAIAEDPEQEDPELLIQAHMMLGDLGMRQLKEIQEEHPRWDLDEEVRPLRNSHYDSALDHYSFPHLYHGDMPEAAAKGLWSAIQVMLFAGDRPSAARRALDLVSLYPETPEAELAKPLAEEAKPPVEEEVPEEVQEEEKSEEKIEKKPSKKPETKAKSEKKDTKDKPKASKSNP